MASQPLNQFSSLAAAKRAKAWPFQEARQLLDSHLCGQIPAKGYVLFETGYGPSGLPHVGTFGEVMRTTMVRRALHQLAPHIPTRLFTFSDDMDGLRKVPDNIPNQAMVAQHIGKPLTRIPDPFGMHASFGHHHNACLCALLDSFGFEYTFVSATECYRSGQFDAALRTVLQHYDAVMAVVLPTLRAERRATYSPFLPVCPRTNRVLQVPIVYRDIEAGTVVYQEEEDGPKVEVPVTGGHCKLQWKADWGMRWYAFGVDYEMSGKDLTDSVLLSSHICRILGRNPPMNLTYELFLDEQGRKISKSLGNGLTMEEWLRYAPAESLALFMYNKPKVAKRLHFDIIPRVVDEYIRHIEEFSLQDTDKRLENPVWHIHAGRPPTMATPVSFSLLLNLISTCHTVDPEIIWHYVLRYAPRATSAPMLQQLIAHAITYARDFVLPAKQHYRLPSKEERTALKSLHTALQAVPATVSAQELQHIVYEVGKQHPAVGNLHTWFTALYQILLGRPEGPRIGSFIALYGVAETVALLERVLAGENLARLSSE
ncbi:Lysyl-tRNA synthetase (class I) [invertebrate metagenome]|uniref:Lysine--tRNA ligase n=1 Tax=invertebrate metagenome TaxID=1711999 RepID=A0A484H7V9_9ZZZZ